MKQVIWVYGCSATGKETFIRATADNVHLQKVLSLPVGKTVFSPASIEHNVGFDPDAQMKRQQIEQDVKTAFANGAQAILLKWQFLDDEANRVKHFQHIFPQAKHSGILLTIPIDEHIARLKRKAWWNMADDEVEYLEWEIETTKSMLAKDGLSVNTIDSSTPNYRILEH